MTREETLAYEAEMKHKLATRPWIGVDLDGTLAKYETWGGPEQIGEPVPLMVERVKQWLWRGIHVKIMTARASYPNPIGRAAIEEWCEKHIGQVLEITCSKDLAMVALYDDRAIQVEPNTGKLVGEPHEP